ncbi:MAG: ribonuclease D [Alphaproteobacteria bacterium CG_4_9_14_3_um_filter_47_13]|nr:MAG: ribonuclease D [Alphaproteobacteria bacterium CG_4_9_14_3_um_filter_47_13]
MTITLHQGDLPQGIEWGNAIAVDTEAMGLNNYRDRLCLVQLSSGDGTAHLVRFEKDKFEAPILRALLENQDITKIFHYARFDIAILKEYLDVDCKPIYCTKIASMLVRTYTDKHGLKELCRELIDVDLSKQQQSSDWGANDLTPAQQTYAANDVFYLHALREKLDEMLKRENRTDLAKKCFEFLPARAELDLAGWLETDIFAHSTSR